MLHFFAVRTGLEPVTPCVTGMYSNQLNERTLVGFLFAGAKVRTFFHSTKFFCKKLQKKLQKHRICVFLTIKKPVVKHFFACKTY